MVVNASMPVIALLAMQTATIIIVLFGKIFSQLQILITERSASERFGQSTRHIQSAVCFGDRSL